MAAQAKKLVNNQSKISSCFKTQTHVKKLIRQPQTEVPGLQLGENLTTIDGQWLRHMLLKVRFTKKVTAQELYAALRAIPTYDTTDEKSLILLQDLILFPHALPSGGRVS